MGLYVRISVLVMWQLCSPFVVVQATTSFAGILEISWGAPGPIVCWAPLDTIFLGPDDWNIKKGKNGSLRDRALTDNSV